MANNNVSEVLRWISKGPLPRVLKYSTYVMKGHHFCTRERDASRVNQNSGVSLMATTPQVASSKDQNPVFSSMGFYGVIDEIWLLDYTNFKVSVFKCDWVDSKNGIKTDDMGFTLVDLNRVGHKSDSFILASQAKPVFYVADQLDPAWSVVEESPVKMYHDDDNLIEGNIEENTCVEELPNIESFDGTDESQSAYMREDCEEGIWVDNNKS